MRVRPSITRPSDQASICGWNQFPDFEELFTEHTGFIEKELLTFKVSASASTGVSVVQGKLDNLRVGILVELALGVPPVTNSLRAGIHSRSGEESNSETVPTNSRVGSHLSAQRFPPE